MHAGDLRDRIRVEQFSASQWALVAVLWSRVLPGGAPLAVQSLAPELSTPAPTTAYKVGIRYRTDIAEHMRVRWGSRTLAIHSIADPDGRRIELELQCSSWLSYADRHAQELAAIAREGFAITFTSATSAGYDSASDTPRRPPATESVGGYGKWIGGTPQQFAPGTLIESQAPVLLFVPLTYGVLPPLGASCAIAGDEYRASLIDAIAPDGTAVAARITVER